MLIKIVLIIMVWHTSVHFYSLIQPIKEDLNKRNKMNRRFTLNYLRYGGYGGGYGPYGAGYGGAGR